MISILLEPSFLGFLYVEKEDEPARAENLKNCIMGYEDNTEIVWTDEYLSWPPLSRFPKDNLARTIWAEVKAYIFNQVFNPDSKRFTKHTSNLQVSISSEKMYGNEQEKRILCEAFAYYLEHSEVETPYLYVADSPQKDRTFRRADDPEAEAITPGMFSCSKDIEEKIVAPKTMTDEEAKQFVKEKWEQLQLAEDIESAFRDVIDEYIVRKGWVKKNLSGDDTYRCEYAGVKKIWGDVRTQLKGNLGYQCHFIEYFANRVTSAKNKGYYVKQHLSGKEEWNGKEKYKGAKLHFPVSKYGEIYYSFAGKDEKFLSIIAYEYQEDN